MTSMPMKLRQGAPEALISVQHIVGLQHNQLVVLLLLHILPRAPDRVNTHARHATSHATPCSSRSCHPHANHTSAGPLHPKSPAPSLFTRGAKAHPRKSRARAKGARLEVRVVELQPLHGPGGAARRARALLGVLGLLLAVAAARGLYPAQRVRACRAATPSRDALLHSWPAPVGRRACAAAAGGAAGQLVSAAVGRMSQLQLLHHGGPRPRSAGAAALAGAKIIANAPCRHALMYWRVRRRNTTPHRTVTAAPPERAPDSATISWSLKPMR